MPRSDNARLRGFGAPVASLLLFVSCIDPVHNDAVNALGPEQPGVRRGPEHRAGQPCATCHGPEGPASPEMSLAGTVFDVRGSTNGAGGVTVTVSDASGVTKTISTNGVGNFYVFKSEWDPVFPLHVSVSSGGAPKEMVSRIGREPSCATCHVGVGDNTRMPGVFLEDK